MADSNLKENTPYYTHTKKDNIYFNQICDQLYNDRFTMVLYGHLFKKTTRTSDNGTTFPVLEVTIRKDGSYIGKLIIFTMVNKWGKDNLFMETEDWKIYRHNNFFKFNMYVNPRYVTDYVECFMDINCDGQVYWMKRIMDFTLFFDSNYSSNKHIVKERKEETGIITIKLDLNVNGTMVPCILIIRMTGAKKKYVTMEMTHNGKQVNYHNARFPAWLIRKKLNRFMGDRDMLSKLSEMTA